MNTRPCIDCHHDLRPAKTPPINGHDTKQEYARGLCFSCHRRRRMAGTLDDVRTHQPPRQCRGCNRLLRPAGTLSKDYPGTVPNRGKSMCQTCNNHAGGPPEDYIDPRDIDASRAALVAFLRDRRRRLGLPMDAPFEGLDLAA